jgi:HD-like signal output (HDOD) protein
MTPSTPKRARLLAELPPFRPVAVQLLRMVGDPSVSFARVAALLRADSVLTAELLRAANSPLFAARQEVTNVLQAIVFLGLDMVSALVATTALRGLVDKRNSQFTYSCWRHSLATAFVCQRLAGLAGMAPERCYTGGVMHDIGQLALLRVFPDYEAVMLAAAERGDDLLKAETHVFGMPHTEAGRWLLSQWGCPLELQNVAALHENPPLGNRIDRDLIVLVHTASNLADLMKMSCFPCAREQDLEQATARFSEDRRRTVAQTFAGLEESVITDVNALEVSLA